VIKIRLGMIKSTTLSQMKFIDYTGNVTKEYSKLGKRITEVFALLDPSLNCVEANQRH
jgi:hypothetical protein